jgi:uncharacterized phage infection (PIP) family protein YhgE
MMEKKIQYYGRYKSKDSVTFPYAMNWDFSNTFNSYNITTYTLVEEVLERLKEVVLQQRRAKLETEQGEVTKVILYRKKNLQEGVARKNLHRISNTNELNDSEELFVSLEMSEELKFKPANRNNVSVSSLRNQVSQLKTQNRTLQNEQKKELEKLHATIDTLSDETNKLKEKLATLEEELKAANTELGELRSLKTKLTKAKPKTTAEQYEKASEDLANIPTPGNRDNRSQKALKAIQNICTARVWKK